MAPDFFRTYSAIAHKSKQRGNYLDAHIHGIRIGRLGRRADETPHADIPARRRAFVEATYFAPAGRYVWRKFPRSALPKFPLGTETIVARCTGNAVSRK